MRSVLKLLIVLGLLFLTAPVVFADPAIMITSYTLTPTVLMPGDSAQLQVTITNTETTDTTTTTTYSDGLPRIQTVETNAATIENIWIASDGDGRNSIKAHNNIPNLGDLAPGASVTVSFLLTAPKNITEGLYFPVLHVDVKTYKDVQYPIPIRVSNLSASLLAKNVPSKISTSGSTPITITAVNKQETAVEDVTITAQTEDTLYISPQTMYLGTMESETSEDIVFSLQPTQIGSYNVSFMISYRNGENLHTDTVSFPVEVVPNSDVSPVFYTFPTTISRGSSKRISLEVYNAKTERITGVIVVPETNLTISPSQYFIGTMDPDDVFSASFDISADGASLGNHTVSFKVVFKQDNEYFESPVISHSIQVVSPSKVKTDYSAGIIALVSLVLVAVVSLFYIVRKRRHR